MTDILKFKDTIIHPAQEYAFAAEDARTNIQKLNFYLYEAWKPFAGELMLHGASEARLKQLK